MDDDMEVMEGIEENVASPDPTLTASQQTTKKSLKLSYEEYRTMANLIVHYLRKKDAEDIRKNDLVAWYIEETLGGDIESQVKIEIMILITLRKGILFPKMFWPIMRKTFANSKLKSENLQYLAEFLMNFGIR